MRSPVWRAAARYEQEGTSTVSVADERYGMGSSRDWAAMALGPLQVTVDRNTLEASEPEPEPEHQHRRLIHKPRGLPVPADTFLDAAFVPIGAIWALDIDLTALLGDPAGMVAVHNPAATIAVPLGFLPVRFAETVFRSASRTISPSRTVSTISWAEMSDIRTVRAEAAPFSCRGRSGVGCMPQGLLFI